MSFLFSLSGLSVELTRATLAPDQVADNFSNVDIEVQKLRVEQMRRLRKELRKLEKLERLRLNKAVGGSPSVEAELLRQINDVENSFDSVSTNTTDVSTKLISSPTKSDGRLVVEGQSATSGSDTNRRLKKTTQSVATISSQKSSLRRFSATKPVTSSSATASKSVDTKKSEKDFGQTFPTPRFEKGENEERGVLTDVDKNRSNKGKQKSSEEKTAQKRKPLAFYLV